MNTTSFGLVSAVVLLGLMPRGASAGAGCQQAETTVGAAEQQFVSLINSARSQSGAASLDTSAKVRDSYARPHSREMAGQSDLHHNPNWTSNSTFADLDATELGENVGMGCTVAGIHQSLMDSASHRQNILSPSFNVVGVGVAFESDGTLWVTQDFAKVSNPPVGTQQTRTPKPVSQTAPRRTPTFQPSPPPTPVPTVAPVTLTPSPFVTTSPEPVAAVKPPRPLQREIQSPLPVVVMLGLIALMSLGLLARFLRKSVR